MRTTVATRGLGLAPSRRAQVRSSRASMAAALASGSRPVMVTCRSARAFFPVVVTGEEPGLKPFDGYPEVPFDLIVEVKEGPAPPPSEDPADRRGAHAAHTYQADPQLRLLTATPAIRGRAGTVPAISGHRETADSRIAGATSRSFDAVFDAEGVTTGKAPPRPRHPRPRPRQQHLHASHLSPGIHPRDLPEPLRSALIGPRARGRLDRLLFFAGHTSITAAAQALGLWHSALYSQVDRLERACGGPLVNRRHPGRHRDPDPARGATLPASPRLPRPLARTWHTVTPASSCHLSSGKPCRPRPRGRHEPGSR
jgi:hypothetical protein